MALPIIHISCFLVKIKHLITCQVSPRTASLFHFLFRCSFHLLPLSGVCQTWVWLNYLFQELFLQMTHKTLPSTLKVPLRRSSSSVTWISLQWAKCLRSNLLTHWKVLQADTKTLNLCDNISSGLLTSKGKGVVLVSFYWWSNTYMARE